jgi:hypothetical protein
MDKKLESTRREFMKESALAGAGLLVPRVSILNRANAAPALQSGGSGAEERTDDRKYADSVILENELMRIELNSRSGDITGLYNKRTGKQYIAAKE